MDSAIPYKGNQYLLVHSSFREDDRSLDLFLGPFEEGEKDTILFFDEADWSDVAVVIGMFPSKSQARKNQWIGMLEPGLNHRQQKKASFIKKDVWVLYRFGDQDSVQ